MSGAPWLDQPVMLHSSRADKCKLTDAQCRYRNYSWRYWYAPLPLGNYMHVLIEDL
jgi:ferric-chelate reductase